MFKFVATIELAVLLPIVFAGKKEGRETALLTPALETKTCFHGYSLFSDGTCVQEIEEAPVSVCPTNEESEKGCRIEVPLILRCPDGHEPSESGECFKSDYVEAKYYCPSDYKDEGNGCVQMNPGIIEEFCLEGSIRIGNSCVQREEVEYMVTSVCPPDSIVENDTCWKVLDTVDCTGLFTCSRTCLEGNCDTSDNTFEIKGGRKRIRQLGLKKKSKVETQSTPEVLEIVDTPQMQLTEVSAPHPVVLTMVKQLCQKKVEVEPVLIKECPAGFSDGEGFCWKEIMSAVQSRCAMDGNPAEACPPVVNYSPKLARCAQGIQSDDPTKCQIQVPIQSIAICPVGFELTPTSCVGYVVAPLECHHGLELVNGRCIGRRVREALVLRVVESYSESSVETQTMMKKLHLKEKVDKHGIAKKTESRE